MWHNATVFRIGGRYTVMCCIFNGQEGRRGRVAGNIFLLQNVRRAGGGGGSRHKAQPMNAQICEPVVPTVAKLGKGTKIPRTPSETSKLPVDCVSMPCTHFIRHTLWAHAAAPPLPVPQLTFSCTAPLTNAPNSVMANPRLNQPKETYTSWTNKTKALTLGCCGVRGWPSEAQEHEAGSTAVCGVPESLVGDLAS